MQSESIPYELTDQAHDAEVLDEDGLSRHWDDAPPTGDHDWASALIAAGAGRRRLSRELGVTEHEARRLLAAARPTTPSDPALDCAAVLAGAPS